MADDDTRTRRRRRPEPAGPGTLRTWRLIGLVLGTLGAVLMVAGWLTPLLDRSPGHGTVADLLSVAGILCALLSLVFLRRVWSEPLHPRTRWTALSDRLSTTFLGLWSLGVFANALQALFGVELPAAVRGALSVLVLASFLATLTVAFRAPAVREG